MPGTTFLCSLDASPFEACGSPHVYMHLKPGRHVFRAISVDAAGEESPIRKVIFFAAKQPKRAHHAA
jgi:hypothetical protein